MGIDLRELRRREDGRRLRREDGLASVELALCLPLLLLVALLVHETGVLMHLRTEAAVGVRRAAWTAALHEHLPGDFAAESCAAVESRRRPGAEFTARCERRASSSGARFVEQMEAAGGSEVAGVAGSFAAAGAPFSTEARARTRYFPFGGGGASDEPPPAPPVEWVHRHSLSAHRGWEHRDLPAGHDAFLRRALGRGARVFPSLLPEPAPQHDRPH